MLFVLDSVSMFTFPLRAVVRTEAWDIDRVGLSLRQFLPIHVLSLGSNVRKKRSWSEKKTFAAEVASAAVLWRYTRV